MAAWPEPIETIRQRLMPEPEVIDDILDLEPDWLPEQPHACPPVPAAVLIALVERPAGFNVLYTERASAMRAHSGQVSFPGGKIEADDAGPAEAALREAWEEVALDPSGAEVLGYLPSYYTGTNYLITPVVAAVRPNAPFVPNPGEVSAIFEVPLALLAQTVSYGTYKVARRGVTHSTWQVLFDRHTIWGITGNITRQFFDVALTEASA